jgi:hypothetical protein
MSNRTGRMMGLVAIALPIVAGCASSGAQVQTRAALDLDCEAANVQVQLTERPYMGVTRYEASGCGASRSYECRARVYWLGVPVGERTCRRNGDRAGPVVTSEGVAF